MLKNIYYASDRVSESGKNNEKNRFVTNYYFSRGSEFRHIEVRTKGKLASIDSVSEEEYLRWRISVNKEDYFKQKDYQNIIKSLSLFGHFMRKQYISSHTDISAENCTEQLGFNGFRKFKDFEEKAFLDGLNGVIKSAK